MYRELIEQSIEKVYQGGVASKILQYMGKIRNESDITQARRWVMELLQNARDLAFPDRPVDVQFILEEDTLTFRHSGRFFRVKDILSIINQVSSKNPGEGVGQFGTGFMTTFQLSEKVEIHSILKEDGCPGKEFRITLDRSGRTKEEILQAIAKNLDELRVADEALEEAGNDRTSVYNTEFSYWLSNENGRRIARTGMTDLSDTILYVMLFSEMIGSVELIYRLPDRQQKILYQRMEHQRFSDGTEELILSETGDLDETKRHTLFSMSEEGATVAAEYDKKMGFLPISERTSRLFVDFPLIGAEEFPFPVVFNHRGLHTNEPRSGISLVDNVDSSDAQNNKAIMQKAVKLYGRFVQALLTKDCRGIDNLLRISPYKDNKEWSEQWVRQHLYQELFQTICGLPILPTAKGRIPLADPECYLIQSSNADEAARVRRLSVCLRGCRVPEDETDWYRVLAAYEITEEKTISLEKLAVNATEYMRENLDEEKMTALRWCSLLYRSCMQNPDMAVRIQSGNVKIFPNQNVMDWNERRLFTIYQIYQDPQIPEALKDVAEKLTLLDHPDQLEQDAGIRSRLLHLSFLTGDEKNIPLYEVAGFTEYIFSRSNRNYHVQSFSYYGQRYLNAWKEAWDLMLACGPDEELYRMCSMVWGERLPGRQKIEDTRFPDSLWNNSYRAVLLKLMSWLEEQQNREALQHRFSGSVKTENLYWWLNCCCDRINRYLHSNEYWYAKILPNQKGEIKEPADLRLDRIEEEELKEIAVCFQGIDRECDVYEILLDKGITLKGWNLPVFQDKDVIMRINGAVQRLLSEMSLSQADMVCQEACARLLSWIQAHPTLAREAFPNYYKEEDQMKLLTPKAAVTLQRKARNLDRLYQELGTENSEELIQMLKKAKEMSHQDLMDSFWSEETSETDRESVLREIGLAGEEYACRAVRNYFLDRGYKIRSEEEGRVLFHVCGQETGGEVEMLYPDTERYHQPGWDIRISYTDDAGRVVDDYYLEVKTHTLQSVSREILQLSNEQMKLAAERREHYILLVVVYDYRSKTVVRMDAHADLIRCLAMGSLYHAEGKYLLQYRKETAAAV